MGEGQVHLVAPALERLGVALHFVVPAGVDVVDAGVDAAADDVGALLVIAAGMAAQADRRDHQAGLALTAIFHVRVVVENLGGIDRLVGLRGRGWAGQRGDAQRQARCARAVSRTNSRRDSEFIFHALSAWFGLRDDWLSSLNKAVISSSERARS